MFWTAQSTIEETLNAYTDVSLTEKQPAWPAGDVEEEEKNKAPPRRRQQSTTETSIDIRNEKHFLTCTKTSSFDRNHGPIQHKCPRQHRVIVDGMVDNALCLSAQDLANDFDQHTVTCVLQCAGNRRHTMRTRIKEVLGVDWNDAALMNCVFEGPRLRDVLMAARVKDGASQHGQVQPQHVQFASYGSKTQEDDWYGASIPFSRAMDKEMDVILAIKMNGELLAHRHGFPVRSIVPGVLGARSVKWLDRITVSDQESPCFYQQRDYKILPPEVSDKQTAELFWSKVPSMLEMPINTCVASPASHSTVRRLASGVVEVQGYAVPQGHQGPVVRVEVSGDEGKTWVDAQLDDGGERASKWSWVLWAVEVPMNKGCRQMIFARATDAGGNTQQKAQSTWNLRGVAYNGYEAAFDLTII
ncbi:hypothetical protein DV736_g5245, partial [Chaetothyriales sp. CBS 134916]